MLITAPNLQNPDDAYALLLAAHDGLSKDKSDALNARLILILCNHIGQIAVIQQALDLSQDDGT